MELFNRWKALFDATKPGRAWKRYADSRGNLLAAGVTYYAFLSIFPLLALAFTVFGVLLRGHPLWLDSIRTALNTALPGFIQDENGENGLIPLSLPGGATLATLGIVGVVGLLWAGLGWLSALRNGIRAAFGVPGAPGNAVTAKLRDLGVLVVMGLSILVSAVVAALAVGTASWLATKLGLGSQGLAVTAVGLLTQALVNTWIVGLALRVLSGVKLPWRGVRNGAIAGGIGLTVLQLFGAKLTAGAQGNPIFGSLAIVAGLLIFLNFVSRVILVSAAWAANDLDSALGAPATAGRPQEQSIELPPARPQPVGMRERTDAGLPTFGQRSADRVAVAAGAVLGAVTMVAMGTLARGIRQLARRD